MGAAVWLDIGHWTLEEECVWISRCVVLGTYTWAYDAVLRSVSKSVSK